MEAGRKPRLLGGRVLWCGPWLKPRYGAVGRYGSIAYIERLWRSLKGECFRRILVPFAYRAMAAKLEAVTVWYDGHRPHQGIHGATPDEVYFGQHPARDGPRYEVRPKWPTRGTELMAKTGTPVELHVEQYRARDHLPIVTLRAAA